MTTIELTVSDTFAELLKAAAADHGKTVSRFVQDYIVDGLQQQLRQQQFLTSLAESL